LLGIFQGVVEMEKKVKQPDEYRRSKDYIQCVATYTDWRNYIPIFLLGIFNGCIICFGLYLSIAVRKIPYSLFNETKVLIFSVRRNHNLGCYSSHLIVV